MRAVIYADDMEPITVVDLGELAIKHLKAHRIVRIEVPEWVEWEPLFLRNEVTYRFRSVVISAEHFVRKGCEHVMLFTHDEESALLLKSAFRPGQQKELRDLRKSEFANGFLAALGAIR